MLVGSRTAWAESARFQRCEFSYGLWNIHGDFYLLFHGYIAPNMSQVYVCFVIKYEPSF